MSLEIFNLNDILSIRWRFIRLKVPFSVVANVKLFHRYLDLITCYSFMNRSDLYFGDDFNSRFFFNLA